MSICSCARRQTRGNGHRGRGSILTRGCRGCPADRASCRRDVFALRIGASGSPAPARATLPSRRRCSRGAFDGAQRGAMPATQSREPMTTDYTDYTDGRRSPLESVRSVLSVASRAPVAESARHAQTLPHSSSGCTCRTVFSSLTRLLSPKACAWRADSQKLPLLPGALHRNGAQFPLVIPAKAGIRSEPHAPTWIPAFAGMTDPTEWTSCAKSIRGEE